MTNYFVRSHVNGYIYISKDKAEDITEVCKECGKRNTILFSFDDKDIQEPEKSMKAFLTSELVCKKDETVKKLDYYCVGQLSPTSAVTEVCCNAICSIDANRGLLYNMLYCECINKKTYDEMQKYITTKLKRYLEFINYINYDMMVMNRREEKVKIKEK